MGPQERHNTWTSDLKLLFILFFQKGPCRPSVWDMMGVLSSGTAGKHGISSISATVACCFIQHVADHIVITAGYFVKQQFHGILYSLFPQYTSHTSSPNHGLFYSGKKLVPHVHNTACKGFDPGSAFPSFVLKNVPVRETGSHVSS